MRANRLHDTPHRMNAELPQLAADIGGDTAGEYDSTSAALRDAADAVVGACRAAAAGGRDAASQVDALLRSKREADAELLSAALALQAKAAADRGDRRLSVSVEALAQLQRALALSTSHAALEGAEPRAASALAALRVSLESVAVAADGAPARVAAACAGLVAANEARAASAAAAWAEVARARAAERDATAAVAAAREDAGRAVAERDAASRRAADATRRAHVLQAALRSSEAELAAASEAAAAAAPAAEELRRTQVRREHSSRCAHVNLSI